MGLLGDSHKKAFKMVTDVASILLFIISYPQALFKPNK